MAGRNAGFSSLLTNESECGEAYYLIWCMTLQPDLVIRYSVNLVDNASVFLFSSKLTGTIGYLIRSKRLVHNMGVKCPYYTQVH